MENKKPSKRVQEFRDHIIKELPFFPNARETKQQLESESLNELLIHSLHWRARFVEPKRRAVKLSPEVTSDKRWKLLKPSINILLEKIRAGEDVSPHLSLRVFRYGYTPVHRGSKQNTDNWADKDMLLNTRGFHHFHLGTAINASKWNDGGLADRTDEVLFAYVTNDIFHAIGIFDHSVFEPASNGLPLTQERERMYRIAEQHETAGMMPGSVYMPGRMIATSGHPIEIVMLGDRYSMVIDEYDPKIDDQHFLEDLYQGVNLETPSSPKLKWRLHHLSLGLIDEKAKTCFLLVKP